MNAKLSYGVINSTKTEIEIHNCPSPADALDIATDLANLNGCKIRSWPIFDPSCLTYRVTISPQDTPENTPSDNHPL